LTFGIRQNLDGKYCLGFWNVAITGIKEVCMPAAISIPKRKAIFSTMETPVSTPSGGG
jgi:hypothetical protein